MLKVSLINLDTSLFQVKIITTLSGQPDFQQLNKQCSLARRPLILCAFVFCATNLCSLTRAAIRHSET